MTRPIRVHYYRVHDLNYPRNSRIRAYLASLGDVEMTVASSSTRHNRLIRQLEDIRELYRFARRSDVLLLSEMRLAHAAVVRFIASLTRSRVVVDGFIGLYETYVEDRRDVPERSFRAYRLRILDAIAVRSADLYLTDTEVRADSVRARFPHATVVALPVGAPGWAAPSDPPRQGPLRILYYGNYIPLHGLRLVVAALAMVRENNDFVFTLIGDGQERADIETAVADAGIAGLCHFLPPVPERELSAHIAEADIVLGIFGSSSKAQSVIANKVWQGLACGRPTITQYSPALQEIARAAGDLLIVTEPGSARSLAEAISATGTRSRRPGSSDVSARLEAYVTAKFAIFGARLRFIVHGR